MCGLQFCPTIVLCGCSFFLSAQRCSAGETKEKMCALASQCHPESNCSCKSSPSNKDRLRIFPHLWKARGRREISKNAWLDQILIQFQVGHACFLLFGTILKASLLFPTGGQLDILCFRVRHATPSCCNWAFSSNPGSVCPSYIQTCFCLPCILSSLWSCMMKYRGSGVETQRQQAGD